jgi:hypothetical protein
MVVVGTASGSNSSLLSVDLRRTHVPCSPNKLREWRSSGTTVTRQRVPALIEAVRILAPVTAVIGWVLVFLALADVPTLVLLVGFYALSALVIAILGAHFVHWGGWIDDF